jgi:tetratricopeptide (TPR) repeat protein
MRVRLPISRGGLRGLVLAATALVLIASCAGLGERRITLRTVPDGAEVITAGGKVLGKTPLLLEGDKLVEAIVDGRLDVTLRAPRYVERQIAFDISGDDVHDVRLRPLDEAYFAQRLMEDFGRQANELVRHLMLAQGLAFAGRLQDAERELNEIEKRFPNLAPIYVLRADIERLRGNMSKARAYLLRAKSVDPNDPVVARLLSAEGKN